MVTRFKSHRHRPTAGVIIRYKWPALNFNSLSMAGDCAGIRYMDYAGNII